MSNARYIIRNAGLELLKLVMMVWVLVAMCGCASDGMAGMGEAAQKASGGDASGRAGSVDSKVVGGYMPGDIESWDVKAQRNTTSTKAGDVYTGVSITAGSGANALREAVASDPIVVMLREEISSLRQLPIEQRPLDRLDALRKELTERIKDIETAAAKATAGITVGDVHQEVKAEAMVGKDAPPVTPADGAAAKEITSVIHAGKGTPESQPTSQPVQE